MAKGQDPQRPTEGWRRERRYEARRRELMARPLLPVRHHATMTAAEAGDVRVCASVGPAGEVITVWSAAEDLPVLTSRTERGPGIFPDPGVARAVTARVTVHAPDIVSVVCLTGLRLANFYVQPLPGGNILAVGARSQWRPEGPDRNAVIYDTGGHALTEEVLGDGIEHVLADSTGNVWAGYHYEGVFGNYGWGHADTPPPVGKCGLIRFAPDLTPAWRYPTFHNPFRRIYSCYALNVDGPTAWTCCDSVKDAPIVRIDEGILTGWRSHVGGDALAVDGSRAALYNPHNYNRLTVGVLHDGHFQVTGNYRIILPGQADLPKHTQVIGRGPCLHFFTGNDWYQLTMSDLPP
jgi:hypothetical protein